MAVGAVAGFAHKPLRDQLVQVKLDAATLRAHHVGQIEAGGYSKRRSTS